MATDMPIWPDTLMRTLGSLPLSWLRACGWALGQCLYILVPSRRRVVWTNLCLCFPAWSEIGRAHV